MRTNYLLQGPARRLPVAKTPEQTLSKSLGKKPKSTSVHMAQGNGQGEGTQCRRNKVGSTIKKAVYVKSRSNCSELVPALTGMSSEAKASPGKLHFLCVPSTAGAASIMHCRGRTIRKEAARQQPGVTALMTYLGYQGPSAVNMCVTGHGMTRSPDGAELNQDRHQGQERLNEQKRDEAGRDIPHLLHGTEQLSLDIKKSARVQQLQARTVPESRPTIICY